jgi:O-antigen/teichoic acid export membrane protein
LLYSGRYTQYANFAWLVGLIALPTAAIAALGSALRAYERPDRVLWAYVVSAVVTCTFGVAAVATWGLLGAILGLLGGYVTTMLVMLWWVLRTDARPEPRTATGQPG